MTCNLPLAEPDTDYIHSLRSYSISDYHHTQNQVDIQQSPTDKLHLGSLSPQGTCL